MLQPDVDQVTRVLRSHGWHRLATEFDDNPIMRSHIINIAAQMLQKQDKNQECNHLLEIAIR